MVSKITSTKRPHGRTATRAFALVEALMAIGVTALLMVAVCSFTMFAGRSFVALFNYVDLDDCNRIAMDQLSRDIRQANAVTDFTPTTLTLSVDANNAALFYTYSPTTRKLIRRKGVEPGKVILAECDSLNFNVCKRNPVGGSYDVYPAADIATAKVIDVSWVCSRTVFGRKENTEAVQTARIVIRKQGT
jgi:Tfp pilus assembly protein PilW